MPWEAPQGSWAVFCDRSIPRLPVNGFAGDAPRLLFLRPAPQLSIDSLRDGPWIVGGSSAEELLVPRPRCESWTNNGHTQHR